MTKNREGLYYAGAPWDDEDALATLLAPLPVDIAENIRHGHADHPTGGFGGMQYDHGAGRPYFVIADDRIVLIWTLPRCSFNQAAEIYAVLDEGPRPIDTAMVRRAFTEVTGEALATAQ
jgi:hypothetical protein